MKPIKEYNCSQEKLNPKKFFPVILFLFGFAFSFALLLSASAESQTLKSISGKDTSITSEPEFRRRFGWNIKAGSGIYQGHILFEINGEMEYYDKKSLSWAINVSQFFSKELEFANLITASPKFYFGFEKLVFHVSPGIGFTALKNTSARLWQTTFGFNLALGAHYSLNEKNKIIFSTKLFFGFSEPKGESDQYYRTNRILVYLSFNIGYGF